MLQIRVPVPRFLGAGDCFFDAGSSGVLRALDGARVAVVCSKSFLNSSESVDRIKKSVSHLDSKFLSYSGEPTLSACKELTAKLSEYKPDWIIAIGGGSVIDAAKIAWLFYEQPDLSIERALIPGAIQKLRSKARFGVLPTTAGTGSEVSSSALFHDEVENRKLYFISPYFLPDLVVLDPLMMSGLSKQSLFLSALDALSHSIEGIMNKGKHTFMDSQAELAVSMLLENITAAVTENSIEAKAALQKAAMIAGWVQNTKIPGLAHAIGHQLGGYGVPHGAAVGLLLPSAMLENVKDASVKSKLERLARRNGYSSVDNFVTDIQNLPSKFEFPNRLSAYASSKAALAVEAVAENSLKDICAKYNPTPLSVELVTQILSERW